MMKRFYSRLLILVSVFLLVSVGISVYKKIPAWYGCSFSVFSSDGSVEIDGFEGISDMNGKLYVGYKGKNIYLVAAGNFQGIECSICMKHGCSAKEFDSALKKIRSFPLKEEAGTNTVNLKRYPDLSMYTNFVLSWEDRMNIWKALDLEKNPEEPSHGHSD